MDTHRPADLGRVCSAPVQRGHRSSTQIHRALADEEMLVSWASQMVEAISALFIGRGAGHSLALEGALKLKEVSYIHAEGFSAAELKHGPIALVEPSVPVVALVLPDAPKVAAGLAEVRARGGRVFQVGGVAEQAKLFKRKGEAWSSPRPYDSPSTMPNRSSPLRRAPRVAR
ncbi:MAG: SIS domain-containing protein [Myxococcota bacterium]